MPQRRAPLHTLGAKSQILKASEKKGTFPKSGGEMEFVHGPGALWLSLLTQLSPGHHHNGKLGWQELHLWLVFADLSPCFRSGATTTTSCNSLFACSSFLPIPASPVGWGVQLPGAASPCFWHLPLSILLWQLWRGTVRLQRKGEMFPPSLLFPLPVPKYTTTF